MTLDMTLAMILFYFVWARTKGADLVYTMSRIFVWVFFVHFWYVIAFVALMGWIHMRIKKT